MGWELITVMALQAIRNHCLQLTQRAEGITLTVECPLVQAVLVSQRLGNARYLRGLSRPSLAGSLPQNAC